ncbi:MAG: hypothetical protein ACJ8EH_06105 [Sphingomicrobium sp.]
MESAMRMPVLLFALSFAAAAAAEPPKVAAEPKTPAPQPAAIVLASADNVRSPAQGQSAKNPATGKRVTPRVTTCRCGDPQPEPDDQDQ